MIKTKTKSQNISTEQRKKWTKSTDKKNSLTWTVIDQSKKNKKKLRETFAH